MGSAADKASAARCVACIAIFLSLLTAALVGATLAYSGNTVLELRSSLVKSEEQAAALKADHTHLAAQLSSQRETATSLGVRLAKLEAALSQFSGAGKPPSATESGSRGGRGKHKAAAAAKEASAPKAADASAEAKDPAADKKKSGDGEEGADESDAAEGKGKKRRGKKRRNKGRL